MNGCASSTVIRSQPPGAQVYINGELMGKTPYTYSDQAIVGTTRNLRLEKEGCEPVAATFSRTEEFNPLACVGGVLLLVPFLWIMNYKGERTYKLECPGPKE
ncbi:MAG: PEGA domain-containing protein [Deltaproteobacteria bacterium]|nr:MAG: PEGA domain-containing protein [Deltaproteobacteria bacterium]